MNNELVFIQTGISSGKTLMKYEPEQGAAFDEKACSFVRLYLFENSGLTAFMRLVLTPTSEAEADLVWKRVGTSKRYGKYYAIEGQHMPEKWGWKESLINQLYISKAHPINSLAPNDGDYLYMKANYGGAVKIDTEKAIERIKQESDSEVPEGRLRKSNEELRIRKALLDGMKLAKKAGQAKSNELMKQGAKYVVKDGFTGISHGTMHDDVGGAWISGVDSRTKLGKVWKKLSGRADSGFYYGDKQHCSIHTGKSQYVSVREAAAQAFVEHVNSVLGTKLTVWTYID